MTIVLYEISIIFFERLHSSNVEYAVIRKQYYIKMSLYSNPGIMIAKHQYLRKFSNLLWARDMLTTHFNGAKLCEDVSLVTTSDGCVGGRTSYVLWSANMIQGIGWSA